MTASVRLSIRAAILVAILGAAGAQTGAQTAGTGRVMRDKLTHAQRILEAIMTSNYALLDRESAELVKATELSAWSVFKSPEYLRQSAAFERALLDLGDAAARKDLEAASFDYVSLTLTCFQCHRHFKGRRLAR